jgi:hypothetical protein
VHCRCICIGVGIGASVLTNNIAALAAFANGLSPTRRVAQLEAERRHTLEMELTQERLSAKRQFTGSIGGLRSRPRLGRDAGQCQAMQHPVSASRGARRRLTAPRGLHFTIAIVQFVGWLRRLANAPRIGVVAAAQD